MTGIFSVASGTDLFVDVAQGVSTGLVTILGVIALIIAGMWAWKFGVRKLKGSAR